MSLTSHKPKRLGKRQPSPNSLLKLMKQPEVCSWASLVQLSGTSSAQCRNALSKYVHQLGDKGSEDDKAVVTTIKRFVSNEVDLDSIHLLVDTVLYYDELGDTEECVNTAALAVEQARQVADINLLRKATSIAGIAYSRICDFENSCRHLEEALNLARTMNDCTLEFAVLGNIVSVLLVMGLLDEAKQIALKLKGFPQGTRNLDYLHLQNCINGMYVSRRTNDITSANGFDELAWQKMETLGSVSLQWKAYVNAEHTRWLILQGHVEEASRFVKEATLELDHSNNLRALIILSCARGSCAVANDDMEEISLTRDKLSELLMKSRRYPLHCEDVLRTLVELFSGNHSVTEAQEELFYTRLLNEHVINTKHRQFFLKVCRDGEVQNFNESTFVSSPSYRLPPSINTLLVQDLPTPPSRTFSLVSEYDWTPYNVDSTDKIARKAIESQLRCKNYDCAESWAIAADFGAQRSGHHCFEVGHVAGLLAVKLGFSQEHSVSIELACRLHDIGKLYVDYELQKSFNDGKIDEYAVVYQHTIAGSSLLNNLNGNLFKLASRIALEHHEWWNGCGYPSSLYNEEICYEARICAVADTFVKLTNSSCLHAGWNAASTVRQVSVMAAVQLDPKVVAALLDLVAEGADLQNVTDVLGVSHVNRNLLDAKSKLLIGV